MNNTGLMVVFDETRYAVLENGLILDRRSGEVVSLQDAPDQTLAAFAEQLRAQRDWIRQVSSVVDDTLKDRIGKARSLDAGTHLVELERKREWDPKATWDALVALQEKGLVTVEEADAAMPRETKRKPDGRKLNSILTQVVADDPEAAQALAQARSERTYIKVARTSVDGEVVE